MFQLVIVLYLLYQQLGIAFLSGVFVSILLIPVNKIITSNIGIYLILNLMQNIIYKKIMVIDVFFVILFTFLGKLTGKLMTEKDKRVKLMSEIIKGIRVIKYHVWEKYFIDKVSSMCIIFISIV